MGGSSMNRLHGVTIVLLLALGAPALADRVHLKDTGTVVTGKPSENGEFLDVLTDKNVIVRIKRTSVAYIESDEAPERIKEAKNLVEVAGRRPEKRAELASSLAKIHDAFVIPALADRLAHASSTEERKLVIKELAARGHDKGALKALVIDAVHDNVAALRSESMGALRRIGDPETGLYFTYELAREDPIERTRATAALGTFPHKGAVGVLAALGNPAGASAGSSRAHIFVGAERAYIAGWTVTAGNPNLAGGGFRATEVAAPVVDVLRDGVVLDVAVKYIVEYETFVRGSVLHFLSGQSFQSVDDWRAWWKKAEPTFELAPAAREQLASLGAR